MSMILIFSEASQKAFLKKGTSELCSWPPMRKALLCLLGTHSEHVQNRSCPLLPKLAPPVFPASMADTNVDPIAQTEIPSKSHLYRAPCSEDAVIFHPKCLLNQLLPLHSILHCSILPTGFPKLLSPSFSNPSPFYDQMDLLKTWNLLCPFSV